MQKQPKFSIIVGMYNHKKYLQTFVETLENQTFKDFEVHFCDDSSNDGTYQFFEKLKKKEVSFEWQYHRTWIHWGMRLAKNLNQGIKKAKGENCMFIMADSFPKEDYLEIMNGYAGPDHVLCGVRMQVDEDRMVDIDYRLKRNIIPQHATVLLVRDTWNAITGNGLCVPTKAFKERGRGWDEHFKGYGGDDNELAAWLFFKGYVFWNVPQAVLFHNYHRSGDSSERTKKLVQKFVTAYAKS